MTIYFPDVSNYQGNMQLESGTVAVFARASEGTNLKDAYYQHFKNEAARVGALFVGYHFLHAGNAQAQAQNAFSVVGPNVPLMIDFEGGAMADAVAFRDAYRKLGGNVRINYLPHWYWVQIGSPSLSPLSDLLLGSSDYTAYSDSGPGWTPYGGLTPTFWQYTDALPYSGTNVDFNAFKGSVSDMATALGLAPTPPAPDPSKDDDDMNTRSDSVTGEAGLSWGTGSRHAVQVTYDPRTGDPTMRVVLNLLTGPWVDPTPWAVTNGRGVYQVPTDKIANCSGIVLEAGDGTPVYYVTAV